MEAVSLKPRERVRHPLKIRNLRVARTEQLAPTMVRITLLGDELHDFTAPGPADHVKLFFPDNNGNVGVPVMTPEGPRRPEGIEVISRDYTPIPVRRQHGPRRQWKATNWRWLVRVVHTCRLKMLATR